MTWASVRPVLASIVEGTTPPTALRAATARGRNSAFRLQPSASDESIPDTRGCWLRVEALGVAGNTPTGTVVTERTTCILSIAYRRDVDAQDLDDAIAADYLALVRRLLTASLWASSTSTIMAVMPEASPSYAPARVDTIDGARILRISIEVLHRSTS